MSRKRCCNLNAYDSRKYNMLNPWIPKRLLEWCLRLFLIVIFGFLTVGEALSAIDVNKSFSPATVYPTQISHLKIVLQNSALSPTLNAAFTDVLQGAACFRVLVGFRA